jgi:hypothetical protein
MGGGNGGLEEVFVHGAGIMTAHPTDATGSGRNTP